MSKIKEFFKYHGAGNDFILVDNMKGDIKTSAEEACLLCDRHFGIGADGLILVESSDKADCFMNYYDFNGSLKPCGNGTRCTAKFFLEKIKPDTKNILVDTREGTKKAVCNLDGSISVNMEAPTFIHEDFPNTPTTIENISFNCVSMGNPHAVGLVKNVSEIDISHLGPKIENDPHFPNKINVEFVEKIKNDYFKVRVWERGGVATLACGTGACAVYAVLKGLARNAFSIADAGGEVTLEFPGGKLFLSDNEKGEIILRGPAVCVFRGEMR